MDDSIGSLIARSEGGDRTAADALFATLYSELHRLAKAQLARGAGGLTLGTTTLLHEAYLDLSARQGPSFPDRGRFMAYAARAMRGLIIDYARGRKAQKRGGQFELTSIEEDVPDPATDESELVRLSEALDDLQSVEPSLVQVVDLKFFCGLTFAEIGAMWGQSERTVQRHWDKARIFLHSALGASL